MRMPTVATMDTLGYIGKEQPELCIDRHFTYWLSAKRNQSSIVGEVPSFDFIVKTYQGKLDEMCSGMKISLTNYFNEIFDEVDVSVTPVSISEAYGTYKLEVALQVIFNGTKYDLSRSIENTGKSFKLLREETAIYERSY